MRIFFVACLTVAIGSASLLVGRAQATAPRDEPKVATDITAKEVQAAITKGLEALTRAGVRTSDHNFKMADAGEYNVAVGFVARPAGIAAANARGLSHDHITEIYYVLKGTGTHVTGGLVDAIAEKGSPDTGPGMGSTKPLAASRSTRLGPGDMQIIPPGVGHSWSVIDAGGIEYLVFRVDTARVLGVSDP